MDSLNNKPTREKSSLLAQPVTRNRVSDVMDVNAQGTRLIQA